MAGLSLLILSGQLWTAYLPANLPAVHRVSLLVLAFLLHRLAAIALVYLPADRLHRVIVLLQVLVCRQVIVLRDLLLQVRHLAILLVEVRVRAIRHQLVRACLHRIAQAYLLAKAQAFLLVLA